MLIGSILLPFSRHIKACDNYHIQSITSSCRIALTFWCQGGKDVKTKNSELSLERASQRRPKYLTEKRTAVKLWDAGGDPMSTPSYWLWVAWQTVMFSALALRMHRIQLWSVHSFSNYILSAYYEPGTRGEWWIKQSPPSVGPPVPSGSTLWRKIKRGRNS